MPVPSADLFLMETLVRENPGSRMFLELARAYKDHGRLPDAVRVLQRGLLIRPGEVEGRRLLARVLAEMDDRPGALEQLNLAAAELSGQAAVFRELAELLQEMGDSDQAAKARELDAALAGWSPAAARDEDATARANSAPAPAATAPDERAREALARLEAFKAAALRRAAS